MSIGRPSILEQEDDLKGLPTQALQEMLRNPSGRTLSYLVAAELQYRKEQEAAQTGREAAAKTAQQPATVAASLAGMQQPIPMSQAAAMAAPPQQPPMPEGAQIAAALSGVTGQPPPQLPTINAATGYRRGAAPRQSASSSDVAMKEIMAALEKAGTGTYSQMPTQRPFSSESPPPAELLRLALTEALLQKENEKRETSSARGGFVRRPVTAANGTQGRTVYAQTGSSNIAQDLQLLRDLRQPTWGAEQYDARGMTKKGSAREKFDIAMNSVLDKYGSSKGFAEALRLAGLAPGATVGASLAGMQQPIPDAEGADENKFPLSGRPKADPSGMSPDLLAALQGARRSPRPSPYPGEPFPYSVQGAAARLLPGQVARGPQQPSIDEVIAARKYAKDVGGYEYGPQEVPPRNVSPPVNLVSKESPGGGADLLTALQGEPRRTLPPYSSEYNLPNAEGTAARLRAQQAALGIRQRPRDGRMAAREYGENVGGYEFAPQEVPAAVVDSPFIPSSADPSGRFSDLEAALNRGESPRDLPPFPGEYDVPGAVWGEGGIARLLPHQTAISSGKPPIPIVSSRLGGREVMAEEEWVESVRKMREEEAKDKDRLALLAAMPPQIDPPGATMTLKEAPGDEASKESISVTETDTGADVKYGEWPETPSPPSETAAAVPQAGLREKLKVLRGQLKTIGTGDALAGKEPSGVVQSTDSYLEALNKRGDKIYSDLKGVLDELRDGDAEDFKKLETRFKALDNFYKTGKLPESMRQDRITNLMLKMSEGLLGNQDLFRGFRDGIEGFQVVDKAARKEYAEGLAAMLTASKDIIDSKMDARNARRQEAVAMTRFAAEQSRGNAALAQKNLELGMQAKRDARSYQVSLINSETSLLQAEALMVKAAAGTDTERMMKSLGAQMYPGLLAEAQAGNPAELNKYFRRDSEGRVHERLPAIMKLIGDMKRGSTGDAAAAALSLRIGSAQQGVLSDAKRNTDSIMTSGYSDAAWEAIAGHHRMSRPNMDDWNDKDKKAAWRQRAEQYYIDTDRRNMGLARLPRKQRDEINPLTLTLPPKK